jgi:hypothetical protein
VPRLFPWLLASALVPLVSCEEPASPRDVDVGLVELSLRSVDPGTILPGTHIVVSGDSFVDDPWGRSYLVLEGLLDGHDDRLFTIRLPARWVDYEHLEVEISESQFAEFGDVPTRFTGVGVVEVESAVDGKTYRSGPVDVDVDVVRALTPELTLTINQGIIFPNEPIAVQGDGLLLPGEGESIAVLEGCFTPMGETTCVPITTYEVAIEPSDTFDRGNGHFAFVPDIAGIEPGRFEGTVEIRNVHNDGNTVSSDLVECVYDLEKPLLYGVDTLEASLGKYITIDGAGFVGGDEADTALLFNGTFTPDATGAPSQIDEILLPEYVDGRTVRYVVNDEDGIGTKVDVRYGPGQFEGLVTPVISWRDQEVTGDSSPIAFRLAPVKQVVYVNFLPAYRESLRHYGLRAVDQNIRDRVLEVVERDFTGINLELRTEPPQDYKDYAEVQIGGPDPNGLGLLGYDNTPGKDAGNLRLYDRIGGVNALTQQDGYPGFGGVFIESMFGYSEDPGGFAKALREDPLFDAVIDPFRPDRGGKAVLAEDLSGALATVTGNDCPAEDRALQVACGVYVMGNLIGTTVSHELGHSLGLADPYGSPTTFHNSGDEPNRMMDGDRPFAERAQLDGQGPSRFCVDEYDYLRAILPSEEAPDDGPRPGCY